jgi:hypothetical protein
VNIEISDDVTTVPIDNNLARIQASNAHNRRRPRKVTNFHSVKMAGGLARINVQSLNLCANPRGQVDWEQRKRARGCLNLVCANERKREEERARVLTLSRI